MENITVDRESLNEGMYKLMRKKELRMRKDDSHSRKTITVN